MIPPTDPFALKFDAIDVDPERAPARAAIENAMAHVAPQDELLTASAAAPEFAQPGFYLLEDAGGRFIVDRDLGVVTLADETLLQRERNAVHGVTLRVVEPSGDSYQLDMQLRITGRVPQMVGGEDFAAIAGLTDETVLTAVRVPTLIVPPEAPAPAGETTAPAAEPEQIAWTRFAAAEGHTARAPRTQPRRGFIVAEPPTTGEPISLAFEGLPAAFAAHLPWSF
ncbi:MAG: hypothetical protein AB7H66_10495 [Hyphomonadaceae bacterium]